MSELFEADLEVLRQNRWLLGLAMSPFAAALGFVFAGITLGPGFLAVVPPFLIAGVVLTSIAWSRNAWHVAEPANVRANAGGIRIGARFVPRSQIRAAYVVPAGNDKPTRVQIRRRMALPIEIAVKSANEGRRLLHALGLDASQSVATFRVLSRAMEKPWYGFVGGLAFLPIMILSGIFSKAVPGVAVAMPPMFLLAILTMVVTFTMPMRLDIGVDGLVLTWFWRKRFISYGDIDLVMPFSSGFGRSKVDGLELTLKSGKQVRIPVTQSGWADGNMPIIDERLREAMESFRMGGAESDAALVRRGDRGIPEWINVLRAIGAGANAGPRTAPVAPERLWRIVEDPQAEPPARAAAAVALGAEPDEASCARLRAVAEATAAPKLRVAIEAAASENEADLEAALAEVEAEDAVRKRA